MFRDLEGLPREGPELRREGIESHRTDWFTRNAWRHIDRAVPRVIDALRSDDPLLRVEAAAMLHRMQRSAEQIVPALKTVLESPKPSTLEAIAAFSLVRLKGADMTAALAVLGDALEGNGQTNSVAAIYLAAAEIELTDGKVGVRTRRVLMKTSPALLREQCLLLSDMKAFVEQLRSRIKW